MREHRELRIVWIEVEGFRRLQQRSFFDFRNPRGEVIDQAIIAGTNGSGKTTLLEAILFGLGQEELIVRDLPKAKRDRNQRGRFPEGARISICVETPSPWFGPYMRADRTNGRPSWQVVLKPFEGGSMAQFGTPEGKSVEYFSSWRAPALLGPVWPTTGRRQSPMEGSRLQSLKQKLVDERTLQGYVPGGSVHHGLGVLNSAWANLHDQDGTTLADQPVESGSAEAGFDLFILEPDGRRRCSIDQASAGEIEVLCMLGRLLDFAGVVLIDEPELHLHPQWQATLLPTLRKVAPHAQIIATSHASPPWEQAFSYQRWFLAPEGDPRRSDLTPPPERG